MLQDGYYLTNSSVQEGTATFLQDLATVKEAAFVVKVSVLAEGFTLRLTNIADLCSFDQDGMFVTTASAVPGNIPAGTVCGAGTAITVQISDNSYLCFMDSSIVASGIIPKDVSPIYLQLTLQPSASVVFDNSSSLSNRAHAVGIIRQSGISVSPSNSGTTFDLDGINNQDEDVGRGGSAKSVLFDRALSARYYYFELKILETGPDSAIGIGLGPKSHKSNKFPGWMKRSVGYHSDDGVLFKTGSHDAELPMCAVYDTMGCGVLFSNRVASNVAAGDGAGEKGEKVQVYFTRNGEQVGKTQFTVPEGGLYPVIAMRDGDRVTAEFEAVTG